MREHETQIRVLYAHTDKAGVVYYGNYLQFFETGRTELLRALGKSYADFERDGIILTVIEASCRYRRPAVYDDLLTVRTRITRVRRTKMDFSYEVLNAGGELLCEGSTVLGCLEAVSKRPRELPADLVALAEGAMQASRDE
jgi:acyl-CoA thioester hydrolase